MNCACGAEIEPVQIRARSKFCLVCQRNRVRHAMERQLEAIRLRTARIGPATPGITPTSVASSPGRHGAQG